MQSTQPRRTSLYRNVNNQEPNKRSWNDRVRACTPSSPRQVSMCHCIARLHLWTAAARKSEASKEPSGSAAKRVSASCLPSSTRCRQLRSPWSHWTRLGVRSMGRRLPCVDRIISARGWTMKRSMHRIQHIPSPPFSWCLTPIEIATTTTEIATTVTYAGCFTVATIMKPSLLVIVNHWQLILRITVGYH
jgi:hypothetical protein